MQKVTRRWGFHALQRLVIEAVHDEKDSPPMMRAGSHRPHVFDAQEPRRERGNDGVPMRRCRSIKRGPLPVVSRPWFTPRHTAHPPDPLIVYQDIGAE
jgi:hypothetical protein